MKKLILSLALLAFIGSGTVSAVAFDNIAVAIDCDHCKKGHKCEDKCKKGDKSQCCEAKAGEGKAEAKSCSKKAGSKGSCKKGRASVKSCHGAKTETSSTDKLEK